MKNYEMLATKIMINALEGVKAQIRKAYGKGYKDGQKEILANAMIYDHEEAEKKAYNRGLNDAWNAARKLCQSVKYGGLEEHCSEIFEKTPFETFDVFDYTASEVIAKIKEYEDKKQEAEIKVGDEIVCEDAHVVITYISPIDEWNGFLLNSCESGKRGQGYTGMRNFKGWQKTGRHFDQIAEVLAEMRGAE